MSFGQTQSWVWAKDFERLFQELLQHADANMDEDYADDDYADDDEFAGDEYVVGEESPPGVTSWTSFDFDLDSPKVVPTAARTPPPLEIDSG